MSVPAARSFEIHPAFAVPMVMAQMEEPDALNRELIALFEQCESQGDRFRNPDPFVARNAQLFESNFTLFEWPQDCVQRLQRFCLANLYRAIGELNGYDATMLQRLHVGTESWFHVARPGAFFGAHNHAMHSWSGVYCVRHDGDDPGSLSGRLNFINPHVTSTMYLDYAVSRFKVPYAYSDRRLRLTAGQLVLFPSWLLHEVMPYEGTSTRITVAFNARFRLTGAKPADVPRGP